MILRHLIESGIERILIGLGGSATVDAGLGMAAALGYRFQDDRGRPVDPLPMRFSDIKSVTPPIITRLPEVIGLSDVETRLTGPGGAIYTFGPQKGLGPVEVRQLDSDLQTLVKRLEHDLGSNFSHSISSGAAGGVVVWFETFLQS